MRLPGVNAKAHSLQPRATDSGRHFDLIPSIISGFIRVGIETLAAAEQLAFRYSLRAYDAVQLASAQFAIRRLRKIGRQGVIFLSADARLLGFAKSEGFTILNPLE